MSTDWQCDDCGGWINSKQDHPHECVPSGVAEQARWRDSSLEQRIEELEDTVKDILKMMFEIGENRAGNVRSMLREKLDSEIRRSIFEE